MTWWLHALECIEQSNVSADELLKKIDNSSTKSNTGLGSRGMSSRSVPNLFQFVHLFSLFSMVPMVFFSRKKKPMVIFVFKNSYH